MAHATKERMEQQLILYSLCTEWAYYHLTRWRKANLLRFLGGYLRGGVQQSPQATRGNVIHARHKGRLDRPRVPFRAKIDSLGEVASSPRATTNDDDTLLLSKGIKTYPSV